MISAKEAKHKIRTVQNIEQICRAMKTVASIRLRRAEQRLAGIRPYRRGLRELARQLAGMAGTWDGALHPFLEVREVKRLGVVLVTSDRGLCGGYNASAVRAALGVAGPDRARVIAVGRRGQQQMARRGYEVVDSLVPLGGDPDLRAVAALADRMGELFASGAVDRVVAVYSEFLGGTRSQVKTEVLLPLEAGEGAGQQIICEPELPRLLDSVLARYLRSQMMGLVLEASASEHASRVSAMTSATDNAEEMIRQLTLEYNKARQAGITKELTEIVGTAEAAT